MGLLNDAPAHEGLMLEAAALDAVHLSELLADEERTTAFTASIEGSLILDYSRQKLSISSLKLLEQLYDQRGVGEAMRANQAGAMTNVSEQRSVLHTALRAEREEVIRDKDGVNVVPHVYDVLDRIAHFSEAVRAGKWRGVTGAKLTNTVVIGIGGSYLGPEFVCEALKFHAASAKAAQGRTLRFLANVDPSDVYRATADLDPAQTLVLVVSKTFTTAETMLNAITVRRWLTDALGAECVGQHMVALSSATDLTKEFGIHPDNVFGFWDWVGGRVSVSCSVGALPMALHFGFDAVTHFHNGLREVDRHVLCAPFTQNVPVLLGMLGVWNSTYLGTNVRAVLPYSQALARFPAHIQQLDMESNGKGVAATGERLPYETGEFIFGEPGTNGQHSFYQLLHQGRKASCELIGFINAPTDDLYGQPLSLLHSCHQRSSGYGSVSNHDELMANFFAQADALALGKSQEVLASEGVPQELIPHKTFSGDRVSVQLLLRDLTPHSLGQLLAVYEHRTAVQGACWGINSFDQWGVELGKALATDVRAAMATQRVKGTSNEKELRATGLLAPTAALLSRYLSAKL